MKIVVITGAASGLGWALAQCFFARGDHIVLVDCNAALLAERETQLAAPVRVKTAVLDLTDAAALVAFADGLREDFPRIDVLVNNAGITHRSPVIHTQPSVLHRVMQVDYSAVVNLTLALYPAIEAAKGHVINIGSMAGWMPVPGRAAYCAAKSALHQFFETFRAEVRGRGVKVLMVYPSFLDTPIEKNALGADGKPARHARSTIGQVRSADWMAARVVQALEQGKERLFPDKFSAFAALLYRLCPRIFHRQIARRFAGEMP
ncbi:MAG: SDR family NAD(P)-dependent oxidoreductase [Pedobacter sp.]|nr:SDR family NAD(P)-dependent oxidoreductase [Pedobacter sp.]